MIALPQMLYLSTGSGRAQMPKLLHWGYTIDHPTFENVTKYLGFTFGFKWALIAVALIFATSIQRRCFWHFSVSLQSLFLSSSPLRFWLIRSLYTSGLSSRICLLLLVLAFMASLTGGNHRCLRNSSRYALSCYHPGGHHSISFRFTTRAGAR